MESGFSWLHAQHSILQHPPVRHDYLAPQWFWLDAPAPLRDHRQFPIPILRAPFPASTDTLDFDHSGPLPYWSLPQQQQESVPQGYAGIEDWSAGRYRPCKWWTLQKGLKSQNRFDDGKRGLTVSRWFSRCQYWWWWWWWWYALPKIQGKMACSALYNHRFPWRLNSREPLLHGKRGCDMRHPKLLTCSTIRDLFAIFLHSDFHMSKQATQLIGLDVFWVLTGSSSVSQKDLSITVTTRPGFSGVPRWSVLACVR